MKAANKRSGPQRAIGSTLAGLSMFMAAAGVSFGATQAAPGGPAAGEPASAATKQAKPSAPVALVDINSASLAQLKTLPGIGDAEARKIVAGRPYLSKADLASKKVIPTGVYLSLKNRVIAIQKQKPKRKD